MAEQTADKVVKFTDATHFDVNKDYTLDELIKALSSGNAKMWPADTMWAIGQAIGKKWGITSQSVSIGQLTHLGLYASIIAESGAINVNQDSADGKWYLDVPENAYVAQSGWMTPISNNHVLLPGHGNNAGSWIYFDLDSGKLSVLDASTSDETLTSVGIMYGTNDPAGWYLRTNLPLQLNGQPVSTQTTTVATMTPDAMRTTVMGFGRIDVDTDAKTLTAKDLYVRFNGMLWTVDSTPLDITPAAAGAWLFFDTQTKRFTWKNGGHHCALVGAWWVKPTAPQIFGNPAMYIDGVRYNYANPLKGHKIAVLGDSITQGVNTTKSYVGDFPTMTGATSINYGLANSSIAKQSGTVANWDTVIPFVDRFGAMDSSADIILIFGGVNDWVAGRPLGAPTDTDVRTFYGALNTMLSGLRKKYIGATILMATPLQTDWTTRPAWKGTTDGKNSQGLMLEEYVNAIKERCGVYSVPVLDLYHGGFYPFDDAFKTTYMTDGLHPTRAGHLKLVARIGKFIEATS